MSSATRMRQVGWVAAPLVALVAGAQLLYYFPRTVDDMFIFLRYAEHASNGDGLVYNLGERVEGYSSVVWVLLLAFGGVFGANLVTWSKLLAVGSFAALLVGQHRFALERLDLHPRRRSLLAFALPLSTACCSYIAAWSMMGLETPLFLALATWSAVALGRYADEPSRQWLVASGALCSGFVLSRPEAPMILVAIAAGLAVSPRSRARIRAVAVGALPAAAAYLAWSVFRRTYYGLWMPHTYYSKQGVGWHASALHPIFTDGAAWPEVALVAGGIAIAAIMIFERREGIVAAVTATTLIFVAKVETDWMPNMHSWLPMWLVLPAAWLWAADRLWPQPAGRGVPAHDRRLRQALSIIALAIVAVTAIHQLGIDTRYSIFSYRARGSVRWVRSKSLEAWSDTWNALSHTSPPELEAQDPFNMGQLTQIYRLIESDARPLEETWFVGPDIGLVGYATPVNVWEPPGLFTPDVRVLGGPRKQVTPTLVAAALNRPVAMTELFDDAWTAQLQHAYEARFEPVDGWSYVRERGAPRPTRTQIMARYRNAVAKLPTSYYVLNVHGGPLGAQIARRVRAVEATAANSSVSAQQ